MVKSATDIKKVLHFQNVLRIAELIRQLRAKNPKATEQELIEIFADDYNQAIILEGLERAKHFISIKSKRGSKLNGS